MGPTIAGDGTIYFFRGGPKEGGPPWLSVMRFDRGQYGAPEYLDETINGGYGGGDSAIARDQSFIIFSSSRPDSMGSGDLYISRRRNGKWTTPRNLGPTVNSRNNECCPTISQDGLRLYFTRSGEGIFFVPLPVPGLP
jgi:hypothetical protein